LTLAPSPRTTGRSPPIRISQPITGALNRDALAIHRMSQRSDDRSHGSAVDWWLATTTYARSSMSAGGRPSTRNRHCGATRADARPNRRIHRPRRRMSRRSSSVTIPRIGSHASNKIAKPT
jgi:hypothetical protein